MRDLYKLYLELGHDVFEERIKKPMELYMHANGNVINMNALNTIVANAMENSKLGEAGFDEHDLFSPPSIEEKIYFDDTLLLMLLNTMLRSIIYSCHMLFVILHALRC